MAVPKRRTSKSRKRMRKMAHKKSYVEAKPCPDCGEPQQSHRICPACGYYKGRQVVSVETE